MINLVDNMNGFFELHKAISIDPVKEIPVDYCPECEIEKKEVDSEGYFKRGEYIKTQKTMECTSCGDQEKIDLSDEPDYD